MATKVFGWFNPARYAPLQWPADEDGIRWDVYADTARLIRSPHGPLRGWKVNRLYSWGWSYTGSFQRTFINSGFHDATRLASGKPVIDGYLIGISSFSFRSGYVPINSHTPNLAEDDPRRANRPIDVPVIELQSENEAITNREPQTPDRDKAPGAHRLYEVPGLTHGSERDRSTIAARQIAARLRHSPAEARNACPYPRTDIDMADYATAALENLDAWSQKGTPPPRAERLRHEQGRQVRDGQGNTLGGIRPAQITVPLARYGAAPQGSGCDGARAGLGSPVIPMRRIPLAKEELARLYPGGRAEYLRRFDAEVDRLVAARWLRAPQAARQKREARAFAVQAFP